MLNSGQTRGRDLVIGSCTLSKQNSVFFLLSHRTLFKLHFGFILSEVARDQEMSDMENEDEEQPLVASTENVEPELKTEEEEEELGVAMGDGGIGGGLMNYAPIEALDNEAIDNEPIEVAPPRSFPVPSHVTNLTCGISWDFFDKPVDLDMSVMVFDSYSFEKDCAFYNKTKILGGAIVHSGDQRDGMKEGDDETIEINLQELTEDIHALFFLVNVFEGGNFQSVETGSFTLYHQEKPIYNFGLGESLSPLSSPLFSAPHPSLFLSAVNTPAYSKKGTRSMYVRHRQVSGLQAHPHPSPRVLCSLVLTRS